MKSMARQMIAAGSVLALALTAAAQSSTTRVKKSDVKKEAQSNFNGSVSFTIGNDTNIGDTKAGTTGSFFELKPTMSYKGGLLFWDINAAIKDYSDQAISNGARESSAGMDLGVNSKIFGNTESTTKLQLGYADGRLPDYFNAGATVTDGDGMPNRKVSVGVAQTLKWSYDKLSIKGDASYARNDYSSTYSDFAGDLFGQQDFQLDHDKVEGKARIGLQLRDNVELAATPLISHKSYDDRQARESNGRRIGDQGMGVPTGKLTEFTVNEMKAELIVKAGAFTLTPMIVSGLHIDQANGGEDYRYNEAGLSAEVLVNKANGVTLKASTSVKNENYDNYTYGVDNGETREDDILSSSVGASFNLTKSVKMALDYSNTLEESNHPSQDLNFRQEIISTGVTVSF